MTPEEYPVPKTERGFYVAMMQFVNREVKQAVAEERERCAKIAEETDDRRRDDEAYTVGYNQARYDIAQRIREAGDGNVQE